MVDESETEVLGMLTQATEGAASLVDVVNDSARILGRPRDWRTVGYGS